VPNVDLTALTGDAVYSKVVLDRAKEIKYFHMREANRLDVVPRQQHPADAAD
jgi:hypothetical protein